MYDIRKQLRPDRDGTCGLVYGSESAARTRAKVNHRARKSRSSRLRVVLVYRHPRDSGLRRENRAAPQLVVVVDVVDGASRTDAATRLVCNWKHTREERIARGAIVRELGLTREKIIWRRDGDGDEAGNDSSESAATRKLTKRRCFARNGHEQEATGVRGDETRMNLTDEPVGL